MKPSAIASTSASWLYLTLLLLGFWATGWLLAAFQVSWLVWLGTLGITLHLVQAETEAIALASTWVVLIMFIAAAKKSWTPVWHSHLPFENARLWAQGLLLIWAGLTGLVVLLALAKPHLRLLGLTHRQATTTLFILIWGALILGKLVYTYRFILAH